MATNPLTSLAFALESQPGVYAVLLGSGVSRAAQIPTGWGITNELIRRVAATEGEEVHREPAAWYEAKFGKPVGFSDLLTELARSRSERRALLARFIEPSPTKPDERRPTQTHRALAKLACEGQVRVFLTTNFDRLLEQALADAGLEPLIVASPAQAEGAMPFQHANAVVFKLHGDYLDPDSMLVTEDELSSYEPAVAARLKQVLEEHALVVCGWSGDWDPALREAITSTTARRYPLYLATTTSSDTATAILSARSGIEIPIDDADSFFDQLAGRVTAISTMSEPHPLDTQALISSVKQALASPAKRIELEDLVLDAANRVHDQTMDEDTFHYSPSFSGNIGVANDFIDQACRYEVITRPLVAALVAGATWGTANEEPLWARAVNRIANISRRPEGCEALINLRRLPALLCVYAAGLAAVERGNLGALRAVALDPTYREFNLPLITILHTGRVMYDDLGTQGLAIAATTGIAPSQEQLRAIEQGQRSRSLAPEAAVLHAWLREPLRATIPDDEHYNTVFMRLELLLALTAIDLQAQGQGIDGASYGTFTWRGRYMNPPPEAQLENEYKDTGDDWPPFNANIFGRSSDRADAAFKVLLEEAPRARRSR